MRAVPPTALLIEIELLILAIKHWSKSRDVRLLLEHGRAPDFDLDLYRPYCAAFIRL